MKTISQYARLCGVSHQAIHDRIRRGILKAEAKTDVTNRKILMIDAKKYPPRKLKAGRPKTKKKKTIFVDLDGTEHEMKVIKKKRKK